jgi:hypothetical protein
VQLVWPEQAAQSAFEKQWLRQTAFTHSCPSPHCAFEVHCGVRAVAGWHTPDTQVSLAFGQGLLASQSAWQMPLMQVALPAQSLLLTQPPWIGVGAGAQWPLVQAWPVPQSPLWLQAASQAPFTHRPFWPQSLLLWQAVAGFTPGAGAQVPFTHSWPLAQSVPLVHGVGDGVVDGAQVPFWQVVPGYGRQSSLVLHRPVSWHWPLLQ